MLKCKNNLNFIDLLLLKSFKNIAKKKCTLNSLLNILAIRKKGLTYHEVLINATSVYQKLNLSLS